MNFEFPRFLAQSAFVIPWYALRYEFGGHEEKAAAGKGGAP